MADWVAAIGLVLSAAGTIYTGEKSAGEAKKSRKAQEAALAKAEAEAKAEKSRIENLDKERKDRLARRGAGLPGSLLTGMSGITGAPATLKPVLG